MVRAADGWHQRMVGLGADGELVFALDPDPIPRVDAIVPDGLRDAPVGALYEWRSDHLIVELATRLVRDGGAALIVDYGHIESAVGETLQAVARHRFASVLAAPGEADLTAHVDFAALSRAAARAGAHVSGPLAHGELLRRLGIAARAAALKATASPAQSAAIDAAVARLTGSAQNQMGVLFKALAIADPKLGPLPGFEPVNATTKV
jgi:NADH dehydrogenase [ubiquinone] 1 alpha subcomplex assembly factor 7